MRNACQWLAVALLVAGCGAPPGERSTGSAARNPVPVEGADPVAPETRIGRLTATEARQFLATHPEALVLDVRNPDEWEDQYGHIEGARQIPLPELSARAGEVEGWKDKPVVLVCRSGRRSGIAAETLAGLGYHQLFNLEGGMIAWRESEPKR